MIAKKWIGILLGILGILFLIIGVLTNWVLEKMFIELFVFFLAGIIVFGQLSVWYSNTNIGSGNLRVIKATRIRLGNKRPFEYLKELQKIRLSQKKIE